MSERAETFLMTMRAHGIVNDYDHRHLFAFRVKWSTRTDRGTMNVLAQTSLDAVKSVSEIVNPGQGLRDCNCIAERVKTQTKD